MESTECARGHWWRPQRRWSTVKKQKQCWLRALLPLRRPAMDAGDQCRYLEEIFHSASICVLPLLHGTRGSSRTYHETYKTQSVPDVLREASQLHLLFGKVPYTRYASVGSEPPWSQPQRVACYKSLSKYTAGAAQGLDRIDIIFAPKNELGLRQTRVSDLNMFERLRCPRNLTAWLRGRNFTERGRSFPVSPGNKHAHEDRTASNAVMVSPSCSRA